MPFRYAIKADPPAPGGPTPQGTGTPGKRTPAERARLAALARWGKYKPGQKPKPKGRKPAAKTPEAKEAERRQAAMDNRSKVSEQLGMDAGTMDGLGTFAMGGDLDPKQSKTLFDAGLITTNDDGSFRVTPQGRQFYNAASRGEVGQARDALAQGTDSAGQARTKEATRQQKEQEKADKEKQPKGGGGGGGGGKEEKPADDPKLQKQTENRAAIGQQMADNDEGLAPSGTTALLAFADGGALDKTAAPAFAQMGLTEGDPPRLSRDGKAAVAAMNKGDYRGAVDAINSAKERKDTADSTAKDRDARQAERDKAKAERTAQANERRAAADKRRAEIDARRNAKPLFRRASAKMVEASDSSLGRMTRFRKKPKPELKTQTAQDRAMFANMGSSGGGGGGGGSGGKPSGGTGGLWAKGPDGKRTPQAGLAKGATPRTSATTAPPASPIGHETRAYGNNPNQPYTLQHKVVDMGELQASNLASGAINPNYNAALQPRDRSRAASQAQIDTVARQLNPDVIVTDFHRIDAGSPIVDAHGNVLSGNGRTLALQHAANMYPQQSAAYRARLKEEAAALGIDPKSIEGMQNPVLVRQLKGDVDPVAFAREANSSGTLRMSTLEQAKVDAHVLSDKAMTGLSVREGQDIDRSLRDASNKPFVDGFLATVPSNERAALLTRDGNLNQAGLYRIKAAVYTKAFPGEHGERMAESMLESLDPEVKSIQNGVSAALPAFSRTVAMTRSGLRDSHLDLSEDMAKTIDVYARIKDNPSLTANTPANKVVAKYLGQTSMFDRELTPTQERLLVHVDSISNRPTAVRDFLNRYARIVEDQPAPGQHGMFGEMMSLTKDQLIDRLISGTD